MRTVFWLTGATLVVSALAAVAVADYVTRHPSSPLGCRVTQVLNLGCEPGRAAEEPVEPGTLAPDHFDGAVVGLPPQGTLTADYSLSDLDIPLSNTAYTAEYMPPHRIHLEDEPAECPEAVCPKCRRQKDEPTTSTYEDVMVQLDVTDYVWQPCTPCPCTCLTESLGNVLSAWLGGIGDCLECCVASDDEGDDEDEDADDEDEDDDCDDDDEDGDDDEDDDDAKSVGLNLVVKLKRDGKEKCSGCPAKCEDCTACSACSHEKCTECKPVTKLYAVGDLVGPEGYDSECLKRHGLSLQNLNIQQPEGYRLESLTRGYQLESLTRVLCKTIEPSSWECNGGCGCLEYYPPSKCLVVKQTPEVHEQVECLLDRLRVMAAKDNCPKVLTLAKTGCEVECGVGVCAAKCEPAKCCEQAKCCVSGCVMQAEYVTPACCQAKEANVCIIVDSGQEFVCHTHGNCICFGKVCIKCSGGVTVSLLRLPEVSQRCAAEPADLPSYDEPCCEEEDTDVEPAAYDDEEDAPWGVEPKTPEELPVCDDPFAARPQPPHEQVCPYHGGCYYYGTFPKRANPPADVEREDADSPFFPPQSGDDDDVFERPDALLESAFFGSVIIGPAAERKNYDDLLEFEIELIKDAEEGDPLFEYPSKDFPDVDTAEFRTSDARDYELGVVPN